MDTPAEIERHAAWTLERILKELGYLRTISETVAAERDAALAQRDEARRERDRLQVAYDLAQEEIRKLRTEISRLARARPQITDNGLIAYPCHTCGSLWPTVRDADACHVSHGRAHA